MDEKDIRAALERILAGDPFRRSKRGSGLLKYIVEEHLAGRAGTLHGATIAQDVFGRGEDFDSNTDPIVRVQVGRVRQMLEAYYLHDGKNDPVRISIPKGSYVPQFSGRPDETPSTGQKEKKLIKRPLYMAAVVSGVLIGLLLTFFFTRPVNPVAAASAIPKGPKVYVTQFEYSGNEDLASVLSNGFRVELIDRLSRFKNLFVFSPNAILEDNENLLSSGDDAPENTLPDFLLTGSIEFLGDKLTVTSQLQELSTGSIVWSETFEDVAANPAKIADVKSSIVSEVAASLGQPYGVIQSYMSRKAAGINDISFDDYLCLLKFYDYARSKNAADHDAVRTCLKAATEHSPNYSMGWAALSWIYGDEVRYGFNPEQGGPTAFERARKAAENAVATDPYNSAAHLYLASSLFAQGDFGGWKSAAEKSLQLNPNDTEALASLGWNFILRDDAERGRAMIEKAIRLNPGNPPWFHGGLAIYYYQKGNYLEAYHHAVTFHNGESALGIILLTASCVHLGKMDEAAAFHRELQEMFPDIAHNPRRALDPWRFREEVIRRIEADLKAAGNPLGSG